MERTFQPLSNPHVRHHSTAFSARGVVWFSLGLIGLLLFSWLLIAGLMKLFIDEYSTGRPEQRLAVQVRPADTPMLQPAPQVDLENMRRQDAALLGSYGWVNRDAGIVRIPIDRAIEILARRGFPVRTEPKLGGPLSPLGKSSPVLPPPPESSLRGETYKEE